jgi:GNAT superfamily N-acetyltransferase
LNIAEASAADIPQLCGLLALLFTQEADFVPDAQRQITGLLMIIEQPAVGRIYCAREGEHILGMVSILFTVSTAEGARAALLEDMVVHPDRRGEGIGEQLLDEAIRRARETGCKRITLLTDDTNEPAMRFYARAGFARSRMVPMRIGL